MHRQSGIMENNETKSFTHNIARGDKVEFEISDLAHGGDSIGRHNGLAIFAPYGVPGDKVKATIKEVKSNYAFAKIEEIITPSPIRVKAPCPYFGSCGGCQWMTTAYASQLEYKAKSISSCLKKFANITIDKVRIGGYEEPFYYRDRAQYKLAAAAEGFYMGFYEAKSHDVIDVQKCCIQKDAINTLMQGAREYLSANKKRSLSIYDEKRNEGNLRYIAARTNSKGDTLFTIITPIDGRNDSFEKFGIHMKENFPQIKGVIMNVNALTGNRVFGNKEYALMGEGTITEEVRGIKFELGAETFFQVNAARLEQMLQFIDRNLPEGDSVVDLYSGVGALSLPFHKKIKKLRAVEVFFKSINSFTNAVQKAKIANAEIIKATAEDAADEIIKEGKTGTVIVDPPRKGLDKKVIDALKKKKVKNLIYISCDPATYARDVKELSEVYMIKEIEALDMFPQTYHVETLSVLVPK